MCQYGIRGMAVTSFPKAAATAMFTGWTNGMAKTAQS